MRNIAIVRRNGLGDLLCTVPLIYYLREHFPEDKITLFVDARNAPLVPYLSPLDEVVAFPKSGNKYWNLGKLAWKWRSKKFDVAISTKLPPMKLMNFFLFLLGAKQSLAVVDNKWHGKLINTPIHFDPTRYRNVHEAVRVLRLVAPEVDEVPLKYYPKITIPQSVESLYGLKSPFIGPPRMLISATTTLLSNRLEADHYAQMVNRLAGKMSFSVILVAQKEDKMRAEEIGRSLKVPFEMHFPRNFDAFMVLLNSCDLYFVGDGGIAHIGAALGKKMVVLFGESSPHEWHPLSSEATCFYHSESVNCIPDEKIITTLEQKLTEVIRGRNSL